MTLPYPTFCAAAARTPVRSDYVEEFEPEPVCYAELSPVNWDEEAQADDNYKRYT